MDSETAKAIERLLFLKFPLMKQKPSVGVSSTVSGPNVWTFQRYLDYMVKVDAERKRLALCPPAEVEAALESAEAELAKAKANKAEIEEKGRSFNQRGARADFEFWAKHDYWTLDESIALLLGRSPEAATWDIVAPYVLISAFAKQYERLRNLALRAQAMNRGQTAQCPANVIAWADEIGIDVPSGLRTALDAIAARKRARDERQTQKASGRTQATADAPYQSIFELVEPRQSLDLNQIEPGIAKQISAALFPISWQELAPGQRLSVARLHDAQNDPANDEENERAFSTSVELERLKTERVRIERLRVETPTDYAHQKQQLAEIDQAISRVHASLTPPKGNDESAETTERAINSGAKEPTAHLPPHEDTERVAEPPGRTRHQIKRRSDQLAAVIAKAKEIATDREDWQSVWASLVRLASAESRPAPLMGYTEGEGVKYQTESSDSPVRWLSKEAFRKRASRKASR